MGCGGMKIIFNGLLEKKSKGCNCKGKKTEYGFTSTKMYILPSGITKTFYQGKIETVSEQDGNFLLSYKGVDANGTYREVFSKVE